MLAMSLVSISAPPTASMSMITSGWGGKRGLLSTGGIGRTSASPSPMLHTSFLSSSSLSFPSSFSGQSLGISFAFDKLMPEKRRGFQVRAAKKYQLCQTKRNRSCKSLARTHGFRRRMRTTSGRAILSRRRAKGRKVLCTKSHHHSGKGS